MKRIICAAFIVILICPICHAGIRTRIEIDTTRNVLRMYHGYRCIGRYDVATGMKEKVIINGKKYSFQTPKGHFQVWKRCIEPLWTPPDWYYQGTIPPVKERVAQKGILGSRALYLTADAIMIHGFTKDNVHTLGTNASHGCIRVRDKDLREIYGRCPIGTQVWVY